MPPEPTDPNNAPPAVESSTAAPATQQPAPSPTYSQEQVNAMIAAQLKAQHDSLNADFRRRTEKPKEAPPPSPKPEPAASGTISAGQSAALVSLAVEKAVAFGEAVREHGLNSAQSALLRKLQPADLSDATAVHDWVKDQAAVFGTSKNNPPSGNTPPTAPVPAPIAPSASSTTVPLERDVSVLDMNRDQIHELMRKKGGNPSKPYHPSNRGARRELRLAWEAAVTSRRLKVG